MFFLCGAKPKGTVQYTARIRNSKDYSTYSRRADRRGAAVEKRGLDSIVDETLHFVATLDQLPDEPREQSASVCLKAEATTVLERR